MSRRPGRKKSPARLWLRPGEKQWIIRHGDVYERTGFGAEQLEDAESALGQYIAQMTATAVAPKIKTPEEITMGEVLSHYLNQKTFEMSETGQARTLYAAKALVEFWSNRPVSDFRSEVIALYGNKRMKLDKRRVSVASVRRELVVLRAAIRFAHESRLLSAIVTAKLPKAPKRDGNYLTRDDVAKLLRQLRKGRRFKDGKPMPWREMYAARFVLLAWYTGRRMRAILLLSWKRLEGAGWIDLDSNVIHFLPQGSVETKKRKGSARIPKPLRGHLSRWHRLDQQAEIDWIVHRDGKPIDDLDRILVTAGKAAGIPFRVTPHILKHSTVTEAFKRGIDPVAASDFFATSYETLTSTYRHQHPDFQAQATEIFERDKSIPRRATEVNRGK